MDIRTKKREILDEVEKTNDEKLLWAIARLLHLDDEGEVPGWHKAIVEERIEKYEKQGGKPLDWDESQKNL